MLNSGLHAYHFQEAEPLKKTSKSGNLLRGNNTVWNMNPTTIFNNVRSIVENIVSYGYRSNVIRYYESLIVDKNSPDQFGKCTLFELARKINDDWSRIPRPDKTRIIETGTYDSLARSSW